jgi:hypothetical protein
MLAQHILHVTALAASLVSDVTASEAVRTALRLPIKHNEAERRRFPWPEDAGV